MSLRSKLLLSFLGIATIVLSFIAFAVYESYIDSYVEEERHIIQDLVHQNYKQQDVVSFNQKHHSNFISFFYFLDGSYEVKNQYLDISIPKFLDQLRDEIKQDGGEVELDGTTYIWVSDVINTSGVRVFTLYEMPDDLAGGFIESFGTEFVIIFFLFFWVLIWAALILSSLFDRLEKQKIKLQEQKFELEEKHDEAMRLSEVKSRFLANISHELRAPLTSLLGYSEMLLQSDQDMHERISGINTIIRNGEYMLNLVNDLLDLSKIEAGKLEINKDHVNIYNVMTDVQHLFATQAKLKNISLEFDYQLPVPETIYTDPVRFKQILVNLISNAIKFTDKGYVKVETACNKDGTLHIYVRDSGIGLTDEQINRIFDDYTQAEKTTAQNYGGTGLGLSLSKTLAQLLGGKILVSSIPGQGSVFTVEINAGVNEDSIMIVELPKEREAKNIYTPEEHDSRYRGIILLVEDNVDNQNLFSNYLSRHGLTVYSAFNGKQALEMIQKQAFDLIIMDAQMPVMDGMDATRELRKMGIETPVVALSGNSGSSDMTEFKAAGCNEYLTKPVKREQLIRVCKLFLPDAGKDIPSQSPLYSTLLEDEPDLIDIVEGFVNRYPELLTNISKLFASNQMDEFQTKIHELKGSGGNVGYLEITNICSQIEFQLSTGNRDEIQHLLDKLARLHPRMSLALSLPKQLTQ